MKKLFITLSLLLVVILASCSKPKTATTTAANQNETAVSLNTDQSMALSAYLAGGLLSSGNVSGNMAYNSADYTLRMLAENNGFTVDNELDAVNVYFDMLKAFMDNGVQSALTITESSSTNPDYDVMVTYTINGETYTIYYSVITNDTENPGDVSTTQPETTVPAETTVETTVPGETTTEGTVSAADEEVTSLPDTTTQPDDEDTELNEHQEFELRGLLVIGETEYALTGKSVVENNETKMWFEAVDEITGNTVRVEIKNEEHQQQFELVSDLDGVTKSSAVKFMQEENLTKVELKLKENQQESTYKFMKVVEDGKTMYKLDYQIGTVKGQVKIQVINNEDGTVTYRYKITENNRTKDVDKQRVHGKRQNHKTVTDSSNV